MNTIHKRFFVQELKPHLNKQSTHVKILNNLFEKCVFINKCTQLISKSSSTTNQFTKQDLKKVCVYLLHA